MFNLFKKNKIKRQNVNLPKKQEFNTNILPNYEAEILTAQQVQDRNFYRNVLQDVNDKQNFVFDSACDDVLPEVNLNPDLRDNILGSEIVLSHFGKNSFIGFPLCAILGQDWIINKACTIPAQDALVAGYNINVKDADLEKTDVDNIEKLKNYTFNNNYNINDTLMKFAHNKRLYGQALCIPIIDECDMSLPFNIDAVGAGCYHGLKVIDPIFSMPILDIDSATNPLSNRFYKPTFFRVGNQDIHYSWFIFNTLNEVSDTLKPTYYYGGVPLPQLIYKQVYGAERTADEAPMLMMSKRLNYMDGNLNAFLFEQSKLEKTLKMFSWLRNNWGVLLKKPDQTIGQIDTSLTDVDTVTMLSFQIVSATAGIPSSRLLETSPKGWQSSGSYEDEQYKRLLMTVQGLDFEPLLNLHYRLLSKSYLGKDYNFECKFEALQQPTPKELAEINEINSRTDSTYINAGVISADEVRNKIRDDNKTQYTTLSEELPEEVDFSDLLPDNEGENENDTTTPPLN